MFSEAEKRKHPRMRVSFNVEVYHPLRGAARYQTKDMSDNGIFIVDRSIDSVLKEGEIVRVQIEAANIEEPMTIDMRVVRRSNDGKGLSFI